MKRRAIALLSILPSFALAGCLGHILGGGEPTLQGKNGSIPLSKLERILDNFADREVVLVADACDAIERDACKTAVDRSLAHRLKTANATAVYDIVTSPNAMGYVVDLYVMVELQRLVWVTEGQARRFWGEKGASHARAAFDEASREISRIADLAMKPEAKASLDRKILEWRKRSPEVEFVSMVRFGSLPDSSGKSALEALGSLFQVFDPLDEASQKLEDTERMTERIFYFSKRLSQLATWQAETALEETLAKPEIGRVLESLRESSASIDRVSKVIERLPETAASERKEILAAWDAREAKINSSVKEIRGTITETKELTGKITEAVQAGKGLAAEVNEAAKSLTLVLKEVEKLGDNSKNTTPAEPARPFNITEYTHAATEFTKLTNQIHETLRDSLALLDSPAWLKRQEDLDRLTRQALGHAGERGKDWVDHFFIRMVEALAIFFALLYGYHLLTRRKGRQVSAG